MKLQMKMLFPIIIIILLCSSALIYISAQKQRDTIQELVEDQINTQIESLKSVSVSIDRIFSELAYDIKMPPAELEKVKKALNTQEAVKNIKIGTNGYIFGIRNSNGLIWTHKEDSKVNTYVTSLDWAKKADILKKDSGSTTYTNNGKKYHVVFKKVSERNKLVAVYTMSDFDQKIENIRNLQIIILAIAMLLIILFIILSIHINILKPVNLLVERMKQVGSGQLDSKIKIKSKDEIALLSKQFNSMVTDMRGMVIKIKDTVNIINSSSKLISQSSNEASISSKQISTAIHEIALGVDHLAQDSSQTYVATSDLADKISHITNNLSSNKSLNFHQLLDKIDKINQELKIIAEEKEKTLEFVRNISVVTEESAAAVEEINATIEEQTTSIEKITFAIVELHFLVTTLSNEISKFKY